MIDLVWPNLVGVLAATIVSFLIGAVWYAPPVMGKTWMTLLGKTEESFRKNRNRSVVFGFLANLLTAYLLGVFVKSLLSANWLDGAEVGFLAWLAFAFSIHFTSYVFEGRPVKLFAMDAVHQLVIFVVMGVILGIWG
ncbi:MAG: DUF1761 domain-containing protein [Thaumarchaeota archaeon]|nr:DUF1761 domain-containing protein [Nitrososphaerota archaeon]